VDAGTSLGPVYRVRRSRVAGPDAVVGVDLGLGVGSTFDLGFDL
jgi:hypothetical protein